MKRVAILQARMGSTRRPGKVLADLAGAPMLARQVARLQRCRELDEIVVATTTRTDDDAVEALARELGLPVFRGSEQDVLSRYVGAARAARAELVVRVTADCPLIDPDVTDLVVRTAREGGCDYASNTHQRTYPQGLDTEAFFADVLERMARLGTSSEAREHVTWFLHRERPELFVVRHVTDTADNSDLRWTVDTEEDLLRARRIYEAFGLADRAMAYPELVRNVRAAGIT
jgi:spore coat polysaccharide biosynthesis protein SpsF